MESFKEIINNLRDRFTNPLFFSFVFSWIFFNWEIVVALFWYDKVQIYHEGYLSLFSFIKAHLNFCQNILFPAFFAIIYTIFNPVVSNQIKVFYAKINAKGESKSLIATESNFIPIEKYIKARKTIDKQKKNLVNIINKESETASRNDELNEKNHSLEQKIRDLEKSSGDLTERINQIYNTNILNGKWTLTYKIPGKNPAKIEIEIINKTIHRVDEFNQKSFVCDIVNFHYDSKQRRIFFIKKIDNLNIDSRKYLINDLFFDDRNKLIGKEDFDIDVEYNRITYFPSTIEFQNSLK